MIRALAFLMALVSTVSASFVPALAQEVKPPAVAIVLRPAAAPIPALKYRLLPEHDTMVPGNAAVFYHRAIEMFQERSQRTAPDQTQGKSTVADEQSVADWITGPLVSIPRDQARHTLETYRAALHETRLAALRQSCNWEFDSRQEGIELLVPEIQQMRSLARLVALQARIAALDRKTEEAIEWLQTGYAMSRHISQGPFLIQGMVGMALTAVMAKPLEDLIQAPGTPSLYWALADRPHPFIDLSAAFEGERLRLEREIPQLRELDTVPWSLERGRMFAEDLQDKLFKLGRIAAPLPSVSESPGLQAWSLRVGLAVLVAQAYPEAKRALVAQGRPPAQVEAMPAVQVAALHTYQLYRQLRDDVFKWASLPYYQAYKGKDEAMIGRQAHGQMNRLLRMFTMRVPAVTSIQMAGLRVDRHLDAIQCVEAIRIYTAAHGKLPSSLEAIGEAPVPLDVATGQPFGYRALGDHAILTAPAPRAGPDIPQYKINYELKLTH